MASYNEFKKKYLGSRVDVDPDTALYTGGYPNHMKRIAAIIRGDFA